jgi:hypothetical protein
MAEKKIQKRFEKADREAVRVAKTLIDEFGVFAQCVIVDHKQVQPKDNRQKGDVISDVGDFELSVSDKWPNASLNESKVDGFVGTHPNGEFCYYIFGATNGPGLEVYWIVDKKQLSDALPKMDKKHGKVEGYYVVKPEYFRGDPGVIWGTSLEDAVRKFAKRALPTP